MFCKLFHKFFVSFYEFINKCCQLSVGWIMLLSYKKQWQLEVACLILDLIELGS